MDRDTLKPSFDNGVSAREMFTLWFRWALLGSWGSGVKVFFRGIEYSCAVYMYFLGLCLMQFCSFLHWFILSLSQWWAIGFMYSFLASSFLLHFFVTFLLFFLFKGPCLEYLLQHKILDTLHTLGRADVGILWHFLEVIWERDLSDNSYNVSLTNNLCQSYLLDI